ncbi:Aegerolysin [Aspergillus oryzae]|uniref:Aegerolysin n=1 Tax=Aspergillus oryzae TaxID=5062 RepID=A0A1S9DE80_ASPOZ|nr:Aegerolysin [Aspergillus oryzae]
MDTDLNKYNSKWVEFHIRDHLKDGEISVRHTVIEDGEFQDPNNRRKSIHEDVIDEIVIPSDGIGEICAHGRRGSEGRLDLFHGNDKICELHWDDRDGRRENLVEMLDESDKYRIEHGGWSPEANGPLGHVYVDVASSRNLTYTLKLEGDDIIGPFAHKESGLLPNTVDLVNTRAESERWRSATDASETVNLPSSVEASGSTTSAADQPKTKEGVSSEGIVPTSMSSSKPGRSSQKGSGNDGCMSAMDAVSFVNKVKNRFAEHPELFSEFLLILQAYQRESRPLRKVYEQVEELFDAEPDLMKDFKKFLPEATAYKR